MTEVLRLQNLALKFLGFRARSKREVQTYLEKKSTNTEIVAEVIAKLESVKLIDDEAFAKWYIESRSRSRPRSKWLLIRELKQKGVTYPDDAQDEPLSDDVLAQRALSKKHDRLAKLPWQEYREKAGSFLARRGFRSQTIEKIVKKTYNGQDVTDS